ncbi:hypothetical protein Back2_10670 [Nocardioides baekrokdamisoli]|uniref:Uncharacterized protein n=1 Tax=Nocardioides baekrokdamisoli TaxID=1804624 RepID=A0A3G9ICU4_9ACTN|nr:hypothetical protein [Nocardioides baekrokdamisoli]BBH16780.1 hypothetical protein Back2_10670 [Nocardioides baekrokdamisoli]
MHDQSTADRRGLLAALFAAVVTARETERTQRHQAATLANSTALSQARESTLRALLAYAAAIEALNWPVPREILADIRMHQGIRAYKAAP